MPTPALTAAQNAARRVYDWTNVRLTREQTAQILYRAGFRGQNLVNMVAIAGRESGYRPGIHGTASPKAAVSGDRGLFGINYSNDKALKAAGVIRTATDLFDPLTNARAAYFLSKGGTNLFPWGAMKGGWTSGGDPFYGTDRTKALAAVQNAANQGLLDPNAAAGDLGGLVAPSGNPFGGSLDASFAAAGSFGGAGPAGPAGPDLAAVRTWMNNNEGVFNAWLKTQDPAAQTEIINSLKGGGSLQDVAALQQKYGQGVVDYTQYLAALPQQQQQEALGKLGAEAPGAPAPTPAPSQQMTDLLRTLGVSYPNAPQPTPALLAFLNGVGLNLSTAEDVKNRAIQRIGAATTDAMADIDRTAGRTKQNVTADLVRRGVLSSGEANTRYARQAEDVAVQQRNVTTAGAMAKETADVSAKQAQDLARQQAIDRVISAEQEQATQTATSKAQTDALRATQAASDLAWQRQQLAQSQSNQQELDIIKQGATQGVVL